MAENWRNDLDAIADEYGVDQPGNWRNDLKAVREFIEAGGGGGGSGTTPEQVELIVQNALAEYTSSVVNPLLQATIDAYEERVANLYVPTGMFAAFPLASRKPVGWLSCNGAQVEKAVYPALYEWCGDNFGAGTDTTFALPNIQGRVIVGYNGDSSQFPMFGTGGATTVQLGITNVPAHTHTARLDGGSIQGPNSALSWVSAQTYQNFPINSTVGADPVVPHENMPPYLVLDWAIHV